MAPPLGTVPDRRANAHKTGLQRHRGLEGPPHCEHGVCRGAGGGAALPFDRPTVALFDNICGCAIHKSSGKDCARQANGCVSRALVRVTSATNLAADTSEADEYLIRLAFTPAYPPMFVQTKYSASECHLHVIIPTHVTARCHHLLDEFLRIKHTFNPRLGTNIYTQNRGENQQHNSIEAEHLFDSFPRGGPFSKKLSVFAKHRTPTSLCTKRAL